MSWNELIERVDEMMQVNSEDIINNPAEVNALIEGWNLLMKNEPELLNSKQKNVYFALMCVRKIFMLNSNDQLLEIKKFM